MQLPPFDASRTAYLLDVLTAVLGLIRVFLR